MQNSVAKKIFAVGSAAAMTLALFAPFAAQAAVHAAGTNVSSSDGTVWMIMPNNTRRAYTSAGAFLSYGFNSWSQVVPASAEDLALTQGSFIPPQDGSIICSDRDDSVALKGTCYEISGGQKFGFTSAAVFTGLGFSFTNSSMADVSWMQAGNMLLNNTTAAHVPGTLVNNNGTVQLMGVGGLLGIPDVATFNSWGYSFKKVAMANAADKAMQQTGVMATRVAGQLSPTALAGGNGGTTCTSNCGSVINGTVTASLASDTPAAGTLVSTNAAPTGSLQAPGQTGADLAHFNFTGSGTVTQIIVNRIGVSSDNSINNVYLYMGNNRITDAGSFSQGKVTFSNASGLFTVSGSSEVSVRIDVAGGISGQTIGAQLASFSVANGTAMATSISGNLFQVAQVNNLAQVTVPNANSITSSGANNNNNVAATINAGTANAILWSAPISVSQRNVLFKYVAFKQIGSISSDSITNLKLMVDGAQVGSTASITNSGANTNVVIFDMTGSPATLQSGGHTIELHGDIVKGSSFNYNFSVQTAADAVFYDTSYNVNVPFTLASGAQIFQLSPGTTTINAGVVSIQQDVLFTQTQFVANQSQTVLGQWTMKAFGEDVKVQTLQVRLTYTGTPATNEGFNNLSLFVNGGAVGSSLSALGANNTYNFGSSNLFTIPAGTTVTLVVKGDSVLNSPTNVTAVQTDLITPASSLQGVSSFTLSPVGGQIVYTGRSLTTGSSNGVTAINSQFTNTNLTTNMVNQKIGSFVVQAGSIDGVRVSSLTVGFPAGANNTFPLNSLANLYIVTPGGNALPVAPQSSNNFPVNFTIAANQTATVDVFADVGTSAGQSTPNGAPTSVISALATTANVTGTPAVAATKTITISGGATANGTATATINSLVITSPFVTSATPTTIATALMNAINASTTVAALVTATNPSAGVVTITANTPGVAGNSITVTGGPVLNGVTTTVASGITGADAGPSTAQVENYAISPTPVVGNIFSITIGTTAVTYTATVGSQANVVAGLVAAINAANLGVTATNVAGTSVNVTASIPGVPFAVGAATVSAGTQISGNGGTLQTSLNGSGSGATSNQSVILNSTGTTAGVAVLGQPLTVGTGSLKSVTLTGSSPSSSFVLGGGTAQPAATYTFFVNVTGGVTINELGFNVVGSVSNNTISSVTVGGSTGNSVGGRFLVTGLNIAVPVGNAGIDVPVTVTYSSVGSPSTVQDQTSVLTLNHVKYLAGNNTITNGTAAFEAPAIGIPTGVIGAGIVANKMFLAGTVPTVTLVSNTNTLVSGSAIVGSITVSAVGGRLDLTQLPVTVSTAGATTLAASAINLIDHATGKTVLIGGNTTVNGGSGNLITFVGTDGLNQIAGGSSRTYDVQVTGISTSGGSNNCSLVLALGAATGFKFNDINGGGVGIAAADGSGNTFIINYPTNSVSIHN